MMPNNNTFLPPGYPSEPNPWELACRRLHAFGGSGTDWVAGKVDAESIFSREVAMTLMGQALENKSVPLIDAARNSAAKLLVEGDVAQAKEVLRSALLKVIPPEGHQELEDLLETHIFVES